MSKNNLKCAYLLFVVLILFSCFGNEKKTKHNEQDEAISNFEAKIYDLNGTWQPDWSYKATSEQPEENINFRQVAYSWGEGLSLANTTFEIDVKTNNPVIIEPGLGLFPVVEILQINLNTIKVIGFRGFPEDPIEDGWFPEFVFHFIDKNKIWIELNNWERENIQYGKNAIWHRLSGPSE